MSTVGRLWMFRVQAVLMGLVAALAAVEAVLFLLPVYGASHTLPVNDENPVIRFEPDREFIWSRDWNFSIVNRVKVNNYGFVSDLDYDPDAEGPLLAVIGDSFVEALMVPFPQTCAGRLAEQLDGRARVYAFGVSGSALSQYLAFASYARDAFRPDGLVVVVIENDYDESLLKYKRAAGMHQFGEGGDGGLVLQRNDFAVGLPYRLGRMSGAVRYLVGNLDVTRSGRLGRFFGGPVAGSGDDDERRLTRVADSKRAVDAFLDAIPEASGLAPERIAFVVDGMRRSLYRPAGLQRAAGSYRDVMRRYFMAEAFAKGYETIDLQPVFAAHYARHGERFDWPQDVHWNALGHRMCFDTLTRSEVVSTIG